MDEIIIKLISVTWPLVLGAILAVGGGWIGDEIRERRRRTRDLRILKSDIADELEEIETTIQNMHVVWTQANVISIKYITDLLNNITTFNNMRERRFLITDDVLRKEIIVFYKKLKDTAEDAKEKLGSLADTEESRTDQTAFDTKFQGLCVEAKAVKEKLLEKPE